MTHTRHQSLEVLVTTAAAIGCPVTFRAGPDGSVCGSHFPAVKPRELAPQARAALESSESGRYGGVSVVPFGLVSS